MPLFSDRVIGFEVLMVLGIVPRASVETWRPIAYWTEHQATASACRGDAWWQDSKSPEAPGYSVLPFIYSSVIYNFPSFRCIHSTQYHSQNFP